MPDSQPRSALLLAAVVSAAVGAGTSFLWIRNVPPPGGPATGSVVDPKFDAVRECAELREKVKALQAEVAEARINLAASRAFPRDNPAVQVGGSLLDPPPGMMEGLTEDEKGKFLSLLSAMRERATDAARAAQSQFEEQELRARLGRDPATSGLPPGKVDMLVAVLREGADRMRSIRAEAGSPGEGDVRSRIEGIARRTRERLGEFLTKEEIGAVDSVLSRPGTGTGEDR